MSDKPEPSYEWKIYLDFTDEPEIDFSDDLAGLVDNYRSEIMQEETSISLIVRGDDIQEACVAELTGEFNRREFDGGEKIPERYFKELAACFKGGEIIC